MERKKMNREWVEKKREETKNNFSKTLDKMFETIDTIKTKMENLPFNIDDDDKDDINKRIEEIIEKTNCIKENNEMIEQEHVPYYFMFNALLWKFSLEKDDTKELSACINKAMGMVDDLYFSMVSINNMDTYLDSEPVEFEGDIVITDPCYFVKKPIYPDEERPHISSYISRKDEEDYPDFDGEKSKIREQELQKYRDDEAEYKSKVIDDWETCDCGNDMEALGFSTSMCRSTIIGDWACAVIDDNTNKPIGKFCADSGQVCVVKLDDIKKYNPQSVEKNDGSDLWTVIKDFKGTVQFIVNERVGTYENETEYHKAGDKYYDYSVIVKGHGVNIKTNEPIDFSTRQIGF